MSTETVPVHGDTFPKSQSFDKKALGAKLCLAKHVHALGSGYVRNVSGILRTSSENFGHCLIVCGNPGILRIKISRL